MKQIELTQGKVALVDDDDYERVSEYKWQATKRDHCWYVYTTISGKNRSFETKHGVALHRFILLPPFGEGDGEVDHRDLNGLNNQKSNLRRCTRSQNNMNRRLPVTNKSGYKGVRWSTDRPKWRAEFSVNGRPKHIGYFTCLIKAARAYDKAAIEHYGEFARLNFPAK